MSLYINTNIASLSAQRALAKNGSTLNQSFERLSTGLRINSAKDDAAGLAIASRFTAQVRGLNQAVRNANDGISMAQTAEAALNEMNSNIQRLRELAVQSANDTNSASDRAALQAEADALVEEIDRVAQKTNFNGRSLLDGSLETNAAKFQIGANKGDTLSVKIDGARSYTLGQTYAADVALDDESAAGEPFTATEFLTIEGVKIRATESGDDTVSYEANTDDALGSAISYAAAINEKSAETGVTAEVQANELSGAFTQSTAAGVTSATLNGIAIWSTADTGGTMEATIDAINTKSDLTGVVATESDSGDLVLTAEDGRDMVFGGDAIWGTILSGTAANGETHRADVKLVSDDDFTVSATGFTNNSVGTVAEDLVSLASMKLTSQSDAADAIGSLDAALRQVNRQQADLGAYLNRFESAVSSLSSISENLAAARSRIQDADFAAETAEFSKNQILQQASTSILAQANVSTQVALSLLG